MKFCVRINPQDVGLQSVKHMENGQKGIKTNVRYYRDMDNRGVGLDRLYCNSKIASFENLH